MAFFFIDKILGRFAEYSIEKIEEISYIAINKGDKKLFGEFNKKNRLSIIKALISTVFVTVHVVACSYVASVLFESLRKKNMLSIIIGGSCKLISMSGSTR
jgi:hypothetical protein